MAAQDLAREAVADHRVGDPLERACLRRAALVDVEVEVEALRVGRLDDPVERPVGRLVGRLADER